MSKDDDQQMEDRKFLHDLATPLTVVRTFLRQTIKELQSSGPAIQVSDKTLKKLEKSLESVQKIELLHAEHKALLSRRYK